MKKTLLAGFITALTCNAAIAMSNSTPYDNTPFSSIDPIDSSSWTIDPVKLGMTAEQFLESESLHFMTGMAARNGMNEFYHFTTLAKAEDKWVVSPNNDVIYSMITVDVSKGFTLELPEAGDRYITAQIVSQEHISTQLVGGGTYTFTGDEFKGSHVAIGIRVGTDATKADIDYIVEQLHPKMKLTAASSEPVPAYDKEKLLTVRTALMEEYNKLPDTFGLMTDDVKKVTDWERFTYATAGAWGLSENQFAMYAPYSLTDAKADECYVATYKQPKVEGFWSITAYNFDKYLMANEHNVVNSGNVTLNDDATFTVHFGACDDVEDIKNYLITTEDNWGFLMRAYGADVEAFRNYDMPEIVKAM